MPRGRQRWQIRFHASTGVMWPTKSSSALSSRSRPISWHGRVHAAFCDMKSACVEGFAGVVAFVCGGQVACAAVIARGLRVGCVGDGAKESKEEEAIKACPVMGTCDWCPGTLMCCMQGRSTLERELHSALISLADARAAYAKTNSIPHSGEARLSGSIHSLFELAASEGIER